MRGGGYSTHVYLLQFGNVLQDNGELTCKNINFFFGQTQAGQFCYVLYCFAINHDLPLLFTSGHEIHLDALLASPTLCELRSHGLQMVPAAAEQAAVRGRVEVPEPVLLHWHLSHCVHISAALMSEHFQRQSSGSRPPAPIRAHTRVVLESRYCHPGLSWTQS